MDEAQLLACLRSLSQERRDVDIGTSIPRVHMSQLEALTFATEYVARNRPCIIQGALDAWPARRLWVEQYLVERAGAMQVTVDVTPNGRADSVTKCVLGQACLNLCQGQDQPHNDNAVQCFVTPDERRMTLAQFFDLLRVSRRNGQGEGASPEVPYIQHQNSSLSTEFSILQQDILPGLKWADAVFGGAPDATNLWIGDERSVTSFHKDHYENLYAVLTGTKVFTLMPPCDVWRMHLRSYPAARWEQQLGGQEQQQQQQQQGKQSGQQLQAAAPCARTTDTSTSTPTAATTSSTVRASPAAAAAAGGGKGRGQDLGEGEAGGGERQLRGCGMVPVLKEPAVEVVWCAIDPRPEHHQAAAQHFPHFFNPSLPRPLVAEVGPGELLYLPAMWYHYVEQRTDTLGCDYVLALNLWYDMRFDVKWCHHQLVEALAAGLGLAPDVRGNSGDSSGNDDSGVGGGRSSSN